VLEELKIEIPENATDEQLSALMNTLVQQLATATAEDRRKIIETINKQASS
jgi:hypothetical protein